MPELMLRPDHPGQFRRTVQVGSKRRVIVFEKNVPVEVKDAEFTALKPDIGNVLFEIERDEKNRPRFVEAVSEGEA